MANFYARYPVSSVAVISGSSDVNIHDSAGNVLTSTAGALNVTGSITASNPSVSTTGTAVPASATMVGGSDGTNLRALKTSATGVLSVDGSASTQPISGTVTAVQATGTNLHVVTDATSTTAATQSGTWNINNVSGTVSLPTGAATEATLAQLPLAQGSTTSGQSGPLSQGAVTTAAPSYTNAQTSPLSLTTAGALRVDSSGSTQPISGTVTVVQPTGTNLHAVLDSTSTTAVTQSTASNLNATVVQATGTNLHVVTDATSTTAVTQATASNLNAQVQGAAASGASKAGNPVQVGGVFNTTQPTVTTGQAVEAQATARGALIVATGVETFTVQTKDAVNTTGSGSSAGATVSTVATLTAPASAVGFVLMCLDTSTANIRWAIGRTSSTTLGQQLQPGRDTGFIPCGANVSICAESGTQNYDIQWVSQ